MIAAIMIVAGLAVIAYGNYILEVSDAPDKADGLMFIFMGGGLAAFGVTLAVLT